MTLVDLDFIVSLCNWTNPVKSASYLVGVNIFCWFLQRQRPVYVVSLFILANYLKHTWSRVRHEILVDPPDREDWTNLPYYDLERTAIEYVKSIWKSWTNMRKNNYYLWIVLTSLFWIALAKIGSVVSFVTILFLISNGVFIAGPLFKTFPVELLGPTTGGEGDEDYSEVSRMTPACDQRDGLIAAEPFLTPSSWGRIIQDTLLKTFDSAIRSRSSSEPPPPSESSSTVEPESSSPVPPSNVLTSQSSESSDDEFLFDSKHFESSSSSTSKSNSFELIHF